MSDIVMGLDEAKFNDEPMLYKEKPKRLPYAVWEVDGKELKLVLMAGDICKIEAKYGKNLLALLDDENGIPPLSTMLTIVQGALTKYHHGYNFNKVTELYDKYTESGKTQQDFLTDVIVKVYEASGFFTDEMMEVLENELTDEN